MKIDRLWKAPVAVAVASLAFAACDDGDSTGLDNQNASVRVLLTDAPSDYIANAWVDIGAVRLLSDDEGDGLTLTLTEDATDGLVELLELQNAATRELAHQDIEPGTYTQLRLIIEEAEVELIDGYVFNDGSTRRSLKVPSGAQSGLKLNLRDAGDGSAGVHIAGGETVLVLDFDVSQSFVIQGNPETPAGINGVIFKPTIRVTARDVAGSISGTVTAADDSIVVEGLTVTAELEDPSLVEEYQTTTATATVQEDGTYTIHFLVPGDYIVTVDVAEGFVTDPESLEVDVDAAEAETGVDFLVDEAPPEEGDDGGDDG